MQQSHARLALPLREFWCISTFSTPTQRRDPIAPSSFELNPCLQIQMSPNNFADQLKQQLRRGSNVERSSN